ncbi:hypothetical protein HNQ88_004878 [Aureibacter tunicatorum]|uniref:Uncharacterized protein n=1 Tax=Aureibacter tunicatorum TaxID=866807 RepID=A0AAE3XPQ9_9BACT|nr:hypothetical protein [Aureibacter tunicatorum]BDD07417.1 hypothetical protein AUTU_49000 [Aureibacter tunicatorum]
MAKSILFAQDGFGFKDDFLLADIFLVHNVVDDIEAPAVGSAVGAEAIGGLGLVIDLHAGRAILMKGTAEPVRLVGMQTVMLKHLCQRKTGFDVGNLRLKILLKFLHVKYIWQMQITVIFVARFQNFY